jgi:type IX secretion system PorP/SprF family membrane protein
MGGTQLELLAQDPHFSQANRSPLYLNPALTATGEGDQRFGAHWKEQWVKVPVNYQTFSVFYDQKLAASWLPLKGFGAGVVFLHDVAGDSRLSWTQIGLRLSYLRSLSEQHQLSAGFGLDLGQRALQAAQLQFGDQYNGELFDPDLLSGESLARQASGLSSLSAGIHYQFRGYRSRNKTGFGVAISHINKPSIQFFDDQAVILPTWFRVHLNSVIETNEEWDVTVRSHYFKQGSYQEILLGAGGRYHWQRPDDPLIIGAGLGYRFGDAWIAYLETVYQQWSLGLSYDINTSDFQTATNGRGGLELSLQYFLLQAKPPAEFKACPIF